MVFAAHGGSFMFFYLDSTAFQPAAFTSRIYCSFHFSVWILLGICTWITPDLLLVSETVSDTVREVDYVQAFV